MQKKKKFPLISFFLKFVVLIHFSCMKREDLMRTLSNVVILQIDITLFYRNKKEEKEKAKTVD